MTVSSPLALHCIACHIGSVRAIEPLYGWPGLRSVVMVEATREIKGQASTERRYYLGSFPAEAKKIAQAMRSQWRSENNMHWVLDMAFGEDQCRSEPTMRHRIWRILRRRP